MKTAMVAVLGVLVAITAGRELGVLPGDTAVGFAAGIAAGFAAGVLV